MTERDIKYNFENLQHPDYSSLLEPVDPREFLYKTTNLIATLNKLSDMGSRTNRGDYLEMSGTELGWKSPNGSIGYGEDIVYGWTVTDQTAILNAEIIIAGRRPRNPRRLKFEIPGLPRTSISISTFNFKADKANLIITFNQEGLDMTNYEFKISNFNTNKDQFTDIVSKKRNRGFQREIAFLYVDRSWKKLDISQAALINLEAYDAVTLLSQEISVLQRSNYRSKEIKDLLVSNIIRRAKSLKELMKAGSLDNDELGTYGDWIRDAEPDKDSALRAILEEAKMNPKDIDCCIGAVQAGSDKVQTLGQLTAKFSVIESGANGNRRFAFPILDHDRSKSGIAASLIPMWGSAAQFFVKDNSSGYKLLEDEISPPVFFYLRGIQKLIEKGVRFEDTANMDR